jgi:DNA-directed RNA polymerase specialized sigma24 family protein
VTLAPFQQVVDDLGPDLLRYLVAAVGHEDAPDCFQETVLSALRSYPRLADGSGVRAWMFTIAHSRVVDHHRAGQRRPVPVDALPEAGSPGPDPVDDELWSAVRRLPVGQRSAVVLRFVGGLRYREIGAALACSEPAARARVSEALKHLRKEMAA